MCIVDSYEYISYYQFFFGEKLKWHGKTWYYVEEVNIEINKIKDYFDSNFLSVSIDKSNFLHFQPKNNKTKGTLVHERG